MDTSIITDSDIIELYEQLNIATDKPIDIDELTKEYRETIAFMEKESISTYVFNN